MSNFLFSVGTKKSGESVKYWAAAPEDAASLYASDCQTAWQENHGAEAKFDWEECYHSALDSWKLEKEYYQYYFRVRESESHSVALIAVEDPYLDSAVAALESRQSNLKIEGDYLDAEGCEAAFGPEWEQLVV